MPVAAEHALLQLPAETQLQEEADQSPWTQAQQENRKSIASATPNAQTAERTGHVSPLIRHSFTIKLVTHRFPITITIIIKNSTFIAVVKRRILLFRAVFTAAVLICAFVTSIFTFRKSLSKRRYAFLWPNNGVRLLIGWNMRAHAHSAQTRITSVRNCTL